MITLDNSTGAGATLPLTAVGARPVTGVVGASRAMRDLYRLVQRVAGSSSTVLVEGESGTGKEVVAASLHHYSGRTGPFVAINCGAMSATLLDSELFGHARGSFTGAAQERDGLFRHAEGGTLFLDEIGELPSLLQAKLLRALETLRIRPVGADSELAVNVRIVAATNRALAERVEQGAFRADLFYRLNVLSLRVPPLRERPEDIAPLARFFAQQLSQTLALSAPHISPAGLLTLRRHTWPGNVRELKNLIERAMLMGKPPDACLQLQSLDALTRQPPGASGYPAYWSLADVRHQHMVRVLEACNGNKSDAARRMGISRKTLERWLNAESRA